MAEVFLSYAREDAGRAKALATALERAGRSVWWDRNIEGGTEYSLEIDDALKAADAVVVLWSSHSVGSAWVRDEAAAGRDSNRLVPVRLDSAEPPLGFRQFQTIDLSRWKGRDGSGLKTLKSAVAAKIARSTSSAPSTTPVAGVVTGRHPALVALVIGLLLIAVAAAYFVITNPTKGIASIAIVPAPSGGDQARSEALAQSLSVEIGAMQAGPASAFELREAEGGVPEDVDYLIQVAASPIGVTASANLSLLARKERQILWTSHLEKPSAEQADLRPQAAVRLQSVLACLAEASVGNRNQLDRPTLKLYLRGCEKFADGIPGLVDEDQLSLLRQVVNRAPRFAPAIAHLALIEASGERERSSRALIAKAKALDPRLAKIYLAEEDLTPRSKWRERQAPLVEGIRVNPDAAALHSALAFEYSQVGLQNDAIASARRSVALDPASPFIRATLIQLLSFTSRVAEAEAELRAAEKIWPTSKTVRDIRWAFDLRVGNATRALTMLRNDQGLAMYNYPQTRIPEAGLEPFLEARINPIPANIDKAIEAHQARVRREPKAFGPMLIALVMFDRIDDSYELLANPQTLNALPLSSGVLFRTYFKKFRQDARFMPLAARIGLIRYWTETGKWPDFCFEPDLPYDCQREAARLQRAGKVS